MQENMNFAVITFVLMLYTFQAAQKDDVINFCDIPCGSDQHPACECATPYTFGKNKECLDLEDPKLAPISFKNKMLIVFLQNVKRESISRSVSQIYALLYDDDLAYVASCSLMHCSSPFTCLSTPAFQHVWENTVAYKGNLSTMTIIETVIKAWINNESDPSYKQVIAPYTRRIGCGILIWGVQDAIMSCMYAPAGLGVEISPLIEYEKEHFQCERKHSNFSHLCLDDLYDESVYEYWPIVAKKKGSVMVQASSMLSRGSIIVIFLFSIVNSILHVKYLM